MPRPDRPEPCFTRFVSSYDPHSRTAIFYCVENTYLKYNIGGSPTSSLSRLFEPSWMLRWRGRKGALWVCWKGTNRNFVGGNRGICNVGRRDFVRT